MLQQKQMWDITMQSMFVQVNVRKQKAGHDQVNINYAQRNILPLAKTYLSLTPKHFLIGHNRWTIVGPWHFNLEVG